MIIKWTNTRSVIFFLVIHSYIVAATAIEESTKRCEAPHRILLFLLTMPSIIGLVRSRSWTLDGGSIEHSGCALQVLMTSDIIDAKPVLESLSL
jgi:hypothetical protein